MIWEVISYQVKLFYWISDSGSSEISPSEGYRNNFLTQFLKERSIILRHTRFFSHSSAILSFLSLNSLENSHCSAASEGHSGGAAEHCWRPLPKEEMQCSVEVRKWRRRTQEEKFCLWELQSLRKSLTEPTGHSSVRGHHNSTLLPKVLRQI